MLRFLRTLVILAILVGGGWCVLHRLRPTSMVGIVVQDLRSKSVAKVVTRKVSYTAVLNLDGYKPVVDALSKHEKAKNIILGEREFEARVPVRMLLGIDLQDLDVNKVTMQEDGTCRIELPPIEILEYTIDITSKDCKISCSAPSTRHIWDRLMREPDYGETVVKGLKQLKDKDFITDKVLSEIDFDGKTLAGELPRVLTSLLDKKGIKAEIVVPPVDARELVESAL